MWNIYYQMDTLWQHEILYKFMHVHLKTTKISDMSNGVKTLFTFDWILPVSSVSGLHCVRSLWPPPPSPFLSALPWLFPQNFKVLTNGNSMNCFYSFFTCNFQLKFWEFCRQITMKRRQTLDLTTHKYRTLGTASELSVKLSKIN